MIQRSLVDLLNITTACLLVVLPVLSSADAMADLRSNSGSWQRAFDVVPTNQPYVARTQNIFKRLKSIVGNDVLFSELYILDSDSQPWAIALQDGNVILSRGALDIVYGASGGSLSAKDARMAFVLGHELNHIARQDFWHEQVYLGFVSENTTDEVDASSIAIERRRESELRADEDGFIYASLAGFDTNELFTSIEEESDFLHYWVEQTQAISDDVNYNASKRVKFLADTMKSLDVTVKYFEYGIRLAHFGDYENAEILLKEFYKVYPSSQALNNLGFVYLQRARQEMPIELAHRFWFPLSLDMYSGLPQASRSLDLKVSEAARRYLVRAVHLLNEALKFDSGDAGISKNLAISHIYLNDYSSALLALEEAIKIHPDDLQLKMLRVISHVENDLKNTRTVTASALKDILPYVAKPDAPLDLLFNAARLFELIDKQENSNVYWFRLEAVKQKIPPIYRFLICMRSIEFDSCRTNAQLYSEKTSPWIPDNNTGMTVGSSTTDTVVRKNIKSWGNPIRENLDGIEASIYQHENGNSLLVIDQTIAIINQVQHGFDFKEHLVQVNDLQSKVPLFETHLASNSLLSSGSGWVANVRDEYVEEIWFADALPLKK